MSANSLFAASLGALGLCGFFLSACHPNSEMDAEKPELLFFCGAGLRAPVAEAIAAFEKENGVTIATDYAGSEHLLGKIKPTRTGDLYLPGDRRYVDLLAGSGLVKSRHTVCWFVPAILVAKGNPKGIRSLEDLLRPGVKVGVGDENACAIGKTTRKIFENNGHDWAEVAKGFTYAAPTVNALGEHIEVGSLDAAIVWDGVATGYVDKAQAVPIPLERNVISTVEIAVLSCARHPEAAEKFAAFLSSEPGRALFRRHGFTVDPPG